MSVVRNYQEGPPEGPSLLDTAASSRFDTRTLVIFLILLTIVVYASALPNGFVWDDFPVLVDNAAVRSLSNVPAFFVDVGTTAGGEALQHYRPLRTTIYAVLYQGVGYSPFWYHLLNVLLHAANVVLVFLLLERLGLKRALAGGLAAVFAVHPINTEAVTSVVGLSDLLFAHFYFLALLFHLRFLRAVSLDRWRWGMAVYAALVLSLLSKELAVTLPLVIVLHLVVFESRGNRDWIQDLAAYVVGLFAVAGLHVLLRSVLVGGLGGGEWAGVTFGRTMLMQAQVLTGYVDLIVFPVGQTVRHVVPIPESSPAAASLIGAAVVLGMVAAAVAARRRNPIVTFGLSWFLLTLLPVMNIVPLPGAMMGERFLYLPLVGLLIAFGGGIPEAIRASAWPSGATTVATGLLLCLLSLLTVRRNLEWRSNLTLFESAVRVSPASNAVRLNLAREYERLGRMEEASAQLRAGAENTVVFYELYMRMGQAAEEKDLTHEAYSWYQRALRMKPGDPRAGEGIDRVIRASR